MSVGRDGGACLRRQLHRAGFADVWVGGHRPFGIDQAARYPLFTSEVIEVMRRTIPADHQDHVATGVIVKAANRRSGTGRPAAASADTVAFREITSTS